MSILGSIAKFKPAPEPSNIIWENLQISVPTMRKRNCLVNFIILLFVFATFILFVGLKA